MLHQRKRVFHVNHADANAQHIQTFNGIHDAYGKP